MGVRGVWWLVLLLAFDAQARLLASSVSGVHGRVSDPDGLPLPGAVVAARSISSSESSPAVATVVTDGQGAFALQLPPGDYRVSADLEGFDRASARVAVAPGASAALDLQLRLSTFQSQVTVKGEAAQPVLGDPRPDAPVTATREVVDSGMLPNSQYDDVLPLLPNVVRGPDGLISVAGSSAPQGGLLVNGLNLADPLSGEAVLLLPLEAVDSVDVFSGGYPAEDGRATGGITSVHTRSGGSEWHASANSFFPRIRFVAGKPHGVDSWEPNVGVNGPVLRDRLWFAQAVSFRYDRSRFETLAGSQDSTYSALMSWTELDWQATTAHRLSAALSFDPQRTEHAGVTAFTTSAATPEVRRGGWSVGLGDRATIGENAFLELRLAAVTGRMGLDPQGTDAYQLGHDEVRGSYFDRRDLRGRRLEASATWSWTAPHGHLVKAGVTAARESLDGTDTASAVDLLDSAGLVARRVAFLQPVGGLRAAASHAGVFVQDSWTASSWLTLDAGVRVDRSSGASPAVAPRLAWTAKLPIGDTTLGGSVGRFSDKLPLEVYGFAMEQPRLVQTWDAAGAVASSVLYSNRTAERLDIPTATRWEVELAHRFNGGWQGRVKYQERHGRHELTVEPILGSPGSGTLLLDSAGRSDARSLELTAAYRAPGRGHEVYLSYVRSATSGSVNTLSAIDGAFRTPYVQPDQIAPLPADVPHRFLAWGLARLPSRVTVAPFLEMRNGFPYSPVDDTWNYAGAANSARLPWFASLDLYVNKVFTISPRLPDVRIGVKLYNILSVHTERDVQRDVARPDFGQTFDKIPRDFTLVFELLWGKAGK